MQFPNENEGNSFDSKISKSNWSENISWSLVLMISRPEELARIGENFASFGFPSHTQI